MTELLEHELRLLFAGDAEQAPAAVALAGNARRRVRQRRRSRGGWGAGALVAASVTAVAVLGGGPLSDSPTIGHVTARAPASGPTGAVPMGGAASCVFGYSPSEVSRRAFAFDGTVAALGPAHSDRPGVPPSQVGVTFDVNEWFTGGAGPTVTVDMPWPSTDSGMPMPSAIRGLAEDGPPPYSVGTRLLVSGEHRWGGTTMADAIAWGCDFTRYYDESTADRWRAATR